MTPEEQIEERIQDSLRRLEENLTTPQEMMDGLACLSAPSFHGFSRRDQLVVAAVTGLSGTVLALTTSGNGVRTSNGQRLSVSSGVAALAIEIASEVTRILDLMDAETDATPPTDFNTPHERR